MFCFPFHVKECATIRSGILSAIASIYDPLGVISPFVLKGKTIRSVSWDDPIPEVLATQWEKWKSDICNLSKLQIQRCFKPVNFRSLCNVLLLNM